ncbi:MAG: long-chain fatty acid--CoA ligase [Deltaproteobacteria bacterium]|nr:long-chain fatty acid--CoA ligase [Deltaproteobacteria bacterium]
MRDLRTLLSLAIVRVAGLPHRLLRPAMRRNAGRPAFPRGGTYAGLGERVARLAGAWAKAGISVGDRILLDLPNDPAFVEARLACLWLGATAVPVPPGTGDDRLGWIAEATQARAYLGPRGGAVPGMGRLHLDPLAGDRGEYEAALSAADPIPRPLRRAPDALVTINFTSGTTGEPKGVMSTGKGWGASLYHALRENRSPVGADEVFLHAVPLATAGSTLILPAVLSGATNVFLPRWDPDAAADLVEAHRVTRIFLTPTMLAEFVDAVRAGRRDASSLRAVIYGTEGAPAPRIQKALEVLGPVLQQGYGMAEALPPVCLLHPDEHARALDGEPWILETAGRPTRAVDLRVTDADGNPLPPGEPGSIRVRGPTVSPGYWRRPDLTAETRQGGYYVTGDRGFLDRRGYLHVLGREGRVPSPAARTLGDWAEARPDVCLAWVSERQGARTLHVVPARSARLDPEELERGTPVPCRVRLEADAPKTASYKLRLDRSP